MTDTISAVLKRGGETISLHLLATLLLKHLQYAFVFSMGSTADSACHP